MQNAIKKYLEVYNVSKFRVGIVCAQFNSDITEQILNSAKETLAEHNIGEDNIDIWEVNGSVEIPVICEAAAASQKYDLLIAIGAIIKGETDHYDYVAKLVTDGIRNVMIKHQMPIGFAVLTTPTKELAEGRMYIGKEAVVAALNNALHVKNINKR